jgi:hypothetical protein
MFLVAVKILWPRIFIQASCKRLCEIAVTEEEQTMM